MSNYNAIAVGYEKARFINFGDIPADYTLPVPNGAASFYIPFVNSIRILKIINTTDANCWIAFAPFNTAGMVNDNDYIPAQSMSIIDYCSNKSDPSALLVQPINTQLQIRYDTVAPTKGKVVVVAIYASTVL